MKKLNFVRNFSIISHIDHGKSTLADRLIELCSNIKTKKISKRLLDFMSLEREKGISIKAQTVRLSYNKYFLNLIDTPGHIDFSYEVDRNIVACEGSLLIIDSTQGIEAQTIENLNKAIKNNHNIIIILNKIDLFTSNIEKSIQQIKSLYPLNKNYVLIMSAKNGYGIDFLLKSIVKILPSPQYSLRKYLKAIIIDSWYNKYLGIIIIIRLFRGKVCKGIKIKILPNELKYRIDYIGIFNPKRINVKYLSIGEIGFLTGNIKETNNCKIGNVITNINSNIKKSKKIIKTSISMVFCNIYPYDINEYSLLKSSLDKLKLSDSSFIYENIFIKNLGYGFKCGFLGILHLEIIKERLKREYNINIIITMPNVIYQVTTHCKKTFFIYSPLDMPKSNLISYIKEPWVIIIIIIPKIYLGKILNLCNKKRGIKKNLKYFNNKIILKYYMPLNEVIYKFYNEIKSSSQGYASYTWEFHSYKKSNLVKVDILINKNRIDLLSFIIQKKEAELKGREMCQYLKKIIPKHLFSIPIQALIGNRVIARETLKPLYKNVIGKCYGGDVSRKKKLLKKQRIGKKRLYKIGNICIPKSLFISILKIY